MAVYQVLIFVYASVGIRLYTIELSNPLTTLMGQFQYIRLVFYNLLKNALLIRRRPVLSGVDPRQSHVRLRGSYQERSRICQAYSLLLYRLRLSCTTFISDWNLAIRESLLRHCWTFWRWANKCFACGFLKEDLGQGHLRWACLVFHSFRYPSSSCSWCSERSGRKIRNPWGRRVTMAPRLPVTVPSVKTVTVSVTL